MEKQNRKFFFFFFRCPEAAPAVCGVKARLDADPRAGGLAHETPDVKGDEAGLTEVQFKCCKI